MSIMLVVAFVGAATIDLCTKDSDCNILETFDSEEWYCSIISAESDSDSMSLQTCVPTSDCGKTKTFQNGTLTGKIVCGLLSDEEDCEYTKH